MFGHDLGESILLSGYVSDGRTDKNHWFYRRSKWENATKTWPPFGKATKMCLFHLAPTCFGSFQADYLQSYWLIMVVVIRNCMPWFSESSTIFTRSQNFPGFWDEPLHSLHPASSLRHRRPRGPFIPSRVKNLKIWGAARQKPEILGTGSTDGRDSRWPIQPKDSESIFCYFVNHWVQIFSKILILKTFFL